MHSYNEITKIKPVFSNIPLVYHICIKHFVSLKVEQEHHGQILNSLVLPALFMQCLTFRSTGLGSFGVCSPVLFFQVSTWAFEAWIFRAWALQSRFLNSAWALVARVFKAWAFAVLVWSFSFSFPCWSLDQNKFPASPREWRCGLLRPCQWSRFTGRGGPRRACHRRTALLLAVCSSSAQILRAAVGGWCSVCLHLIFCCKWRHNGAVIAFELK